MDGSPSRFVHEAIMKAAAVVAAVVTLSGPLALTALASSTEDERFAAYLRADGKQPSQFILPTPPQGPHAAARPPVDAEASADRGQHLNGAFVASSDRLEGCRNAPRADWKGYKSRFCKAKPSLLPIYEKVATETGIPVGLLYAVGEYETHNVASDMSDGGKSCGLFGFNTWRSWGFSSRAQCHDAEASIRKLAESYQKNGGAANTYLWLRKHNGGPKKGPKLEVTAVYAERVLWAAEHLYAS